ncbi:MAG: glycosyltransferase [Cellulosilyticaceae bacterium]
MKVAILTMFQGLSNTYSLVYVVKMHLEMLLAAGIEVKLLVSEECPDEQRAGIWLDERIEWVKVTNQYQGRQIIWYDYYDPTMTLHDTFEGEVQVVSEDFERCLEGVDVCMLHDILYQGKHYIHNMAIRKTQKALPRLKFVAFTHSFPVNVSTKASGVMKGRYTSLPQTLYVYPTRSGIGALASQFGISEGLCRVIYHPIEWLETMSLDVKRLHEQVNLLEPEILIVYPARLTPGKQFDKVVALAGALKTMGEQSIKVIFCDFPSKDIEPMQYKNEVKVKGLNYGLDFEDMVFTSEIGWACGFPHQGVIELFSLSNVYVCPSLSESFGLTVFEAARGGNLIILNENVPALREIGKQLAAYFMKWDARCMGYDIIQKHEPSEATYYGKHAKAIIACLKENKAVMAKTKTRQRFNKEWIWKHQFWPLLEDLGND